MKKTYSLLFLFVLLFVCIRSSVFAQSTPDFIWQTYAPTNISGVSDLQSKLEKEMQKIVSAGHLAPFRALYGEGASSGGQYYYYRPYETMYTLALAYPYVNTALQSQIVAYMNTELATAAYQPWSANLLPPENGILRQNDTIDRNLFNAEASARYTTYRNRPKLFALYALWLYGYNTGQWNTLNANFSAITSFYNSNRTNETSKYYTSIAGAIGMARLATQLGNTTLSNTAVSDATSGMSAGTNLNQFGLNAENVFKYDCGERWEYCHDGSYMGFQFIDITPEIGRYISANASLKSAVLGNSSADIYSLKRGEYQFPVWFVSGGPSDSIYFGEGYGNAPDARGMIFPLKAWVQKEPVSKLRMYVNAPDALVGDYYYIQNLVRTIQAHGTECWEDLRTTSVECPQSGITPGPTGVSPTIPVQPTSVPGDITGDGQVTYEDFDAIVKAFTSIFPFATVVRHMGE